MELPELISRCKKQNRQAQQQLFERFAPRMHILCRRYVKEETMAEELMLSGFLKMFQSLPTFKYESEAQTLSWFKRIMINECLQHLRKSSSFIQLSDGMEPASEEEDAISKLSAEEIYYLVMELPVGYRTVFNLYVLEGLSHKDIASMLAISEGTSKSQLSKSRSMLQQMIIKKHSYAALAR